MWSSATSSAGACTAAMVMGRLRSALRAYAIETSDPADALERLDRKAHHFEAGQMMTILYGVLEPWTGRMELSSAGHLLPVLALPGVEAVSVDGRVDPPLGVLPLVTRHRIAVEIPSGASLCMFTDGLVERRNVPLDENIDRLRKVVAATHPEVVCRSVLAAMQDDQATWTTWPSSSSGESRSLHRTEARAQHDRSRSGQRR